MKLTTFFSVAFILVSTTIFGQNLRGQIIDASTKEPIPFANVQLGKNYGVISNDEGFFSIQPKEVTSASFLLFSSLGHQDKQILVSEFVSGQIVELILSNEELDEVLVSNVQLTANQIITKFIANKNENHNLKNTNIQLFSRNFSAYQAKEFSIDVKKASFLNRSERKSINERMESLTDKVTSTISENYREQLTEVYKFEDTLINEHYKSMELINRDKSTDTEEIQSLVFFELLSSLESENSFKVKTGIITLDKDVELNDMIEEMENQQANVPDTLHHKNTANASRYLSMAKSFDHEFLDKEKRYNYDLKGITYAHGYTCYHIHFSPSGGKGKYHGNMYINTKDFGMVAYDYELVDGKKAYSVNLKMLLGIKANSFENSGYFIYSKAENGYFAKYIRQKEGDYVYFNRSLSFTENNTKRSQRKKLKFNFELEYIDNSTTEFVAIQQNSISAKMKEELQLEGYILIDERSNFDPDYWKGFNIIEATEAIKNYD